MSFKTTYVLFGILIAILVIFNVSLLLSPGAPRDESYVFPSAHQKDNLVTANDITRVVITQPADPSGQIIFTRADGASPWKMEKPAGFRIAPPVVDRLVNEVMRARRQVTNLGSAKANFGLDKPQVEITLSAPKKDNRTFKLSVGRKVGDQIYLLSSEYDHPLVAAALSLPSVLYTLNDYRDRSLLAMTETGLKKIEVVRRDKKVVLQSNEGKWTIADPNYGEAQYTPTGGEDRDHPTGMKDVLDAILQLKAIPDQGFDEENAPPSKQQIKGVDSEKSASLVVKVRVIPIGEEKEVTRTLLLGEKVKKEVDDDRPADRFARLEGYPHIFRVPGKAWEMLNALADNPAELRSHAITSLNRNPDVIRVQFADSRTPVLFVQENAAGPVPNPRPIWKMFVGDEPARVVEPIKIRELLTQVQNPQGIKSFPVPGTPEANPGTTGVTVSLWTNGIQEAGKDGKKPKLQPEPDYVLKFGRRDLDDNSVVVERTHGEEKDVVKVDLTCFEVAARPPIEFIARRIPPFALDEEVVEKLVVQRDNKTFELSRPPEKEWVFIKPGYLSNHKADTDRINAMLRALNNLQVSRWVALSVTGDQRGRYGLNDPLVRLEATVGKDGKPVIVTFGKETRDRLHYYGTINTTNDVFEIPKPIVDESFRKSMQSMKIFDFPTGQVRGLKIKGWQKDNKPVELELLRLSRGSWTVNKPEGMAAFPQRLETLITNLSKLEAREYEAYQYGGSDPKHGLQLSNGAVSIEVLFVQGIDRKPVILTVGKEKDGDYFAVAGKITDTSDVFRIPKETFFDRANGQVHLLAKPENLVKKR